MGMGIDFAVLAGAELDEGEGEQAEAEAGSDEEVTGLVLASRTFAQTRKEREGTTA
jgi:hypothetical protein